MTEEVKPENKEEVKEEVNKVTEARPKAKPEKSDAPKRPGVYWKNKGKHDGKPHAKFEPAKSLGEAELKGLLSNGVVIRVV